MKRKRQLLPRTADLHKKVRRGHFGLPLTAAVQLCNELEEEVRRWQLSHARWCVAMMACGVTSFGTLDEAFVKLQGQYAAHGSRTEGK